MTSDTKAIIIAVITTGVAVIGVVKSDFADMRADMREIRTAVNTNTAEIAEMLGALNAHIGGHNHSPKNSPTVASAE